MTSTDAVQATSGRIDLEPSLFEKETLLHNYYICCISRHCSINARKQVLTGKAKFGIIGDGKELPQIALATQFKKGDWRSGYYRDQTLFMALDMCSVEQFFAQLYADPQGDPYSGGRQMNSHFATPTYDAKGRLLPLKESFNSSSDISSTAGQMGRGLGLAFASKKFRELPEFHQSELSENGNEICWVTIGDASTSEGAFWESLNAAGVLQVPMVVSVWDDGYGISVPIEYQTTKGSISAAVAGLQRDGNGSGIEIIEVRAWDYPALLHAYKTAAKLAREEHVPVLVHVKQVTQQLGHSTSGSHERYKSKERLAFEKEYDCNLRFRNWLIDSELVKAEDLDRIEQKAEEDVKIGMAAAWKAATAPGKAFAQRFAKLLPEGHNLQKDLASLMPPTKAEVLALARRYALSLKLDNAASSPELVELIEELNAIGEEDYHTNLYLAGEGSAAEVSAVPATFSDDAESKPGFTLLNRFFDDLFARDERVLAFGEDVGHIGDVNQGFAGLQEKYGEQRVFDTGIREWTIIGQAIGLALRGFRPIAEIQYLDYLVYALSPLTDDLATTLYRTDGIQRAPAIIRTRGHRLEGIWHSGSPLGMMVNSLRGMNLCVPRNMLQAVGMYNALLKSSEPGIVVEVLNGYRLRERVPSNLTAYTVPLGKPEILTSGEHLTLLTYGACVAVCEKAIRLVEQSGVQVELIDAQTLLPFDVNGIVGQSVRKTNRLLIVDEDVPGGASAYLLNEVMEKQDVFQWLDAKPQTLTAKAHRPPFGSDGDYFTKPNPEDVAEAILSLASF